MSQPADVITNICQCPSASCVKIGFDIGAGNGDDDSDSSSTPSLIGPIIGAIAGLAAIACIAFFVIRKRRQKKRRSSVLMLGQDDSNDSFSKRWNPSSGSEFAGHKDVIRIAYIPSMIGDSPAGRPGSSALPAPQPQFASLRNGDRNKHDSVGSVGSHMSAVLDEAVVMAVTTKATPQVMNFNAIKASQSDLIQRSNTLHSTNSIKRSTSQRRIADAKKNTTNTTTAGVQRTPSPLAGGARSGSTHVLSDSDENDSDPESSNGTSVTQTAHMKRRSAEKQNLMDSNNNPFMSPSELLTSGSALPSPSGTSVTRHNEDTLVSRKGSTSPYRTSNPFMSQSESATLIPGLSPDTHAASSNRFSTVSSSSHPSPALSASSTFASIPIRLGGDIIDDSNDPLSPFADLAGGSNLRPWMSSGTPALRDSTFSTMSDARSSTRGDGEEIMIFWGGQHNRDSKASNI
ncbi:hypothetical protein BGZ97_000394 [Linnemannia gamsii]|uniref:Membrane anchor Opy2 N-terminal domain-containing protein n=1 Tax=Linnemannia gamsii TaxID=64522 RepID=A0A9P6UTK4_9FUNG|nr:hypothetical protein BGZ97_000394 [Linnemannia gamsii]